MLALFDMEPTDETATPETETSRVYFSMTVADKAKLVALSKRKGYSELATYVRVRCLELIAEDEAACV